LGGLIRQAAVISQDPDLQWGAAALDPAERSGPSPAGLHPDIEPVRLNRGCCRCHVVGRFQLVGEPSGDTVRWPRVQVPWWAVDKRRGSFFLGNSVTVLVAAKAVFLRQKGGSGFSSSGFDRGRYGTETQIASVPSWVVVGTSGRV
jgi:hypothetical protein